MRAVVSNAVSCSLNLVLGMPCPDLWIMTNPKTGRHLWSNVYSANSEPV